MYRSFDKNCYEMLVACGYRYLLIGDRLNEKNGMADFEVIPCIDRLPFHSSVVFSIDSPEAIHLVNEQQPVGLLVNMNLVVGMAMAA